MRILLIHNYYLQKGGEDTVFRSETELLKSHGHEVEQLSFHNKDIDSAWGKISMFWKGLYNRKSYRLVEEKIAAFKPDIIHIHNLFYLASPSILYAARKMGVPVVMTLHNYRLICPSVYLYHKGRIYEDNIHKTFPVKAIFQKVWNNNLGLTALITLITSFHKYRNTWNKLIDGYIVFTEFAKSKFVGSSIKVPEKKFFIKPNFTEDNGCNLEHREDYYLFIGRLSEEKGMEVLLEAANKGNFRLEILGDGPFRDQVEALAAQNERVSYPGFLPKEEIVQKLKSCRALIFPSIWYEGMPMVILEALATGTPIIVSDLGNPGRMIEDRQSGLHFEPNNSESLLSKIAELDASPELQNKLVKGAREIYEKKYTPEENYETLLSVYENILQKSRQMV
ncbi:MAG: glycosyltransferase family 4 protein [Bacteroidota bacterium]